MNTAKGRACALCFAFLLLTAASTAQRSSAFLGGPADSVELDRSRLSAAEDETRLGSDYVVREMHNSATAVREYISPSGVVFGIAWNGQAFPDLTELLGPYADEYREALKRTTRRPGRPYLKVATNGVVVEQWGHVRDLHGRAYAPNLVPSGVSIDTIQ